MARAQQNAYRRMRAQGQRQIPPHQASTETSFDTTDADQWDQEPIPSLPKGDSGPKAQCLPVGELPDDFDGIPLDGSQYLAMSLKANESLPFAKSVVNPYEVPDRPAGPVPMGDANGAGPSRHPALPKESWGELFPLHFRNYRRHVLSQIQSQAHPYPARYPPLPDAPRRSEWYAFINGYIPTPGDKGKARAPVELTEEELMNAEVAEVDADDDEMDMDMDDEDEDGDGAEGEASQPQVVGKTSNGNIKKIGPVREPLVGVIRQLNSTQALRILAHFATWLAELINQRPSPFPSSPELLPTQPDTDPSKTGPPGSARPSASTSSAPSLDLISSNYLAWIFALLCILDEHLSSDQISILRELARSAMKVAGYRWVMAVVSGDASQAWQLGETWKGEREAQREVVPGRESGVPVAQAVGSDEEERRRRLQSVDDTLAKCWMIVYAVAAGWGQKDLLMELETLFT
ncbi:hypothetical protein IAU60_001023 [Kwoniella sp. DSM 27419]